MPKFQFKPVARPLESSRDSLRWRFVARYAALLMVFLPVTKAQAQTEAPKSSTPSSIQSQTSEPAKPADTAAEKPRVNRVFTKLVGIDDKVTRIAVLKAVELRGLKRRAAATDAQIRRLFRKAPSQISRALEPFGYYQAQVNSEISFSEADGKYSALFTVALGQRATLSAVEFSILGPGAEDEALAKAWRKRGIKVGEDLDHTRYESAKSEIQRVLNSRGYLDSELVVHRIEVRRSDATAKVQLQWQSGVRYALAQTKFSGMQFSEQFMQRYVSYQPGDLYTQRRLLEMQQRLVDADYFSVVEISPEIEAAEKGSVPIAIELTPAKRSIYTYGLSFGTDSGVGVRGGLERRWVNDRGHKLRSAAEVSQRLKAAALSYEIPLADKYRSAYGLNLSYRDQETDSSRAKLFKLGVAYSRERNGWRETLAMQYLQGDFEVGGEPGSSTLLYPELILYKRKADDLLYPREGYALTLNARAGAKALLSDANFANIAGEFRYIRGLSDTRRLLLRTGLGALYTDDFSKLPPDLRFFAGGDRSLRGYGYQELGPSNALSRVRGGKYLATGSVEFEQAINESFAIAAFVDTGNAFDANQSELKIGAGLGLRWRSPVGLVRIDTAFAVKESGSPLRLHLVIGPDL